MDSTRKENDQDFSMNAEPQEQHKWLQQLVGQWTYETEAEMSPDKPAVKFKGTETIRGIGGLWIIGESQGEMPGGGIAQMVLTLGYDPLKGRFIGTFVGYPMISSFDNIGGSVPSFISSIIGAIVVLAIYRAASGRR